METKLLITFVASLGLSAVRCGQGHIHKGVRAENSMRMVTKMVANGTADEIALNKSYRKKTNTFAKVKFSFQRTRIRINARIAYTSQWTLPCL